MKKITAQESREQLSHANARNSILCLAMHAMVFHPVEACERFTVDGMAYNMKLYRSTAAHGGIVTVKTRSTEPNVCGDGISAYYLDEMSLHASHYEMPYQIAVSRLRVARQQIWDAEKAISA